MVRKALAAVSCKKNITKQNKMGKNELDETLKSQVIKYMEEMQNKGLDLS